MVYDILNEQFASPIRGCTCMYNGERERESAAKLIYNKPTISVWQGSTYLN